MEIFKIFNKKGAGIGFNGLSSGEKKRIMESALRTANKEQSELVKAYRETCCKVS